MFPNDVGAYIYKRLHLIVFVMVLDFILGLHLFYVMTSETFIVRLNATVLGFCCQGSLLKEIAGIVGIIQIIQT